jgi:hypothetical protein
MYNSEESLACSVVRCNVYDGFAFPKENANFDSRILKTHSPTPIDVKLCTAEHAAIIAESAKFGFNPSCTELHGFVTFLDNPPNAQVELPNRLSRAKA